MIEENKNLLSLAGQSGVIDEQLKQLRRSSVAQITFEVQDLIKQTVKNEKLKRKKRGEKKKMKLDKETIDKLHKKENNRAQERKEEKRQL